jgi:hypothetical protein
MGASGLDAAPRFVSAGNAARRRPDVRANSALLLTNARRLVHVAAV